MEEEKMKDVLDWQTPQGVKDIQKFLGLANYYHWFIKDFAVIDKLLCNMVKKDQKWEWTEWQEKAFGELNDKFMKEPVLAAPDLNKKMGIEVDVLYYATSEVLSIECEDRQ